MTNKHVQNNNPLNAAMPHMCVSTSMLLAHQLASPSDFAPGTMLLAATFARTARGHMPGQRCAGHGQHCWRVHSWTRREDGRAIASCECSGPGQEPASASSSASGAASRAAGRKAPVHAGSGRTWRVRCFLRCLSLQLNATVKRRLRDVGRGQTRHLAQDAQ